MEIWEGRYNGEIIDEVMYTVSYNKIVQYCGQDVGG